MSKLKRLNLDKQRENLLKPVLDGKTLYYSGFCLTDNMNFAFFYADTKFFVDNMPTKTLNRFKLNEADLDIEVDRSKTLIPSKGVKKVSFTDIGQVDRTIFNTMKNIYPNCVFHQVKTLFGQTVNSIVIVLHEDKGKPVGLLKTH
jgi:hypothetical protein